MAKALRVLIAGAGIGGLTAALALLQKGIDVEVFERAPELKEAGAGLHCSPNGVRVLQTLGLNDALERVAVKAVDRDIRLWDTGQSWRLPNHGASSEERYGAPYLFLHRGDLHAMLVNAIRVKRPEILHVNARCVDFAQDGSGVTLDVEGHGSVRGDVLIGADGVKSIVRGKLFGDDNPKFTGRLAWRGLVPIERLPEPMRAPITTNWIGPNGSVTTYPVRKGELMNFVTLVNRDDWQAESWTDQGTIDECLHDMRGWHDDVHEIIRNIDVPYKWGLFLRDPLTSWTSGRISLLGDACHPMLPYLGQGANMAIEDGMVLARSLDAFDDVEVALTHYERARGERASTIVLKSREQGDRVNRSELGDSASAARYIEAQWSGGNIAQRYDWIFDYDATSVEI